MTNESNNELEPGETLCEVWDVTPTESLPHSRFYYLEPVGVGTPMVESMTSYIARLTEAHSIYPYTFFRKELVPLLEFAGSKPDSIWLSNFWHDSSGINSLTATAENMVKSLEQLTLRSELRNLTMLHWKHVLSSTNLLWAQKSWCPMCYEEWYRLGKIIYEPLLWSLKPITSCGKHNAPLQQCCPNIDCKSRSYPLVSQSLPGFCPYCKRWLGQIASTDPQYEEVDVKWQQWVYNNLGDLLAATSNLTSPVGQGRFADALNLLIQTTTNGNASAFAEEFQLYQTTVSRWQQGVNPQIGLTLRMCASLGISPKCLFVDNLNDLKTSCSATRNTAFVFAKDIIYHNKFDYDRAKKSLELLIQNPEVPPPSLTKVCRQLKYVQGRLRVYFPEYCQVISQQYLDYRAQKRKERVQRICEEVREAT